MKSAQLHGLDHLPLPFLLLKLMVLARREPPRFTPCHENWIFGNFWKHLVMRSHLVCLGFCFEVDRLSSYYWRRWGWDKLRPVEVWVLMANWLGTFLLLSILPWDWNIHGVRFKWSNAHQSFKLILWANNPGMFNNSVSKIQAFVFFSFQVFRILETFIQRRSPVEPRSQWGV